MEKFQIWATHWYNPESHPDGPIEAFEAHYFTAGGNAYHSNNLTVDGNINGTDLNLSNKNKENPNEVDGTKGSWTIQEGANNLFLINRNTGEKYKFMLDKVE